MCWITLIGAQVIDISMNLKSYVSLYILVYVLSDFDTLVNESSLTIPRHRVRGPERRFLLQPAAHCVYFDCDDEYQIDIH